MLASKNVASRAVRAAVRKWDDALSDLRPVRALEGRLTAQIRPTKGDSALRCQAPP